MEKEEFYSEKEIISAITRFKNASKRGDNCYFDIYEYEGIIDYFFDNDNINNASKAIDNACAQHPGSISLKMRKAQLFVYNGEADHALEILNNIDDLESNNSDLLFLTGNALLLRDKPDEAEKQFARLIEVEIEDYEGTLFDIANACELCDYKEMALKYYNKYLAIHPYSKKVWNIVANIYFDNNDIEKALIAYDYAIAIDPEFPEAILGKANGLILNKKYKEALISLFDYQKLQPEDLHVNSYLGECYLHLGDFDEAVKYFGKIIDKDNKPGAN